MNNNSLRSDIKEIEMEMAELWYKYLKITN